nr:MAG TPA: hypothetical protein [Caudoviricetes sp.]
MDYGIHFRRYYIEETEQKGETTWQSKNIKISLRILPNGL